VLHYKKQFVIRLDNLVQLDHVGVPDLFKDLDFSGDHVDVLLIGDLALLEDFNGDLLLSNHMRSHHDFSKGALAKSLLYLEMRNLF
jgi:hypothetical protein